MQGEKDRPWPHAPTHHLAEGGTYFVTAATYKKAHHFRGARRLQVLERGLLKLAQSYGWRLEAWAVFSNHYHFVGHAPAEAPDARSLRPMLRILHVKTSGWVNRLEQTAGRKIWHNFWETRLTYQTSLLARLRYTHENAVRHGLVPHAVKYPWCSAAWFERTASRAQVHTLQRFKIDRLHVADDYQPSPDW